MLTAVHSQYLVQKLIYDINNFYFENNIVAIS